MSRVSIVPSHILDSLWCRGSIAAQLTTCKWIPEKMIRWQRINKDVDISGTRISEKHTKRSGPISGCLAGGGALKGGSVPGGLVVMGTSVSLRALSLSRFHSPFCSPSQSPPQLDTKTQVSLSRFLSPRPNSLFQSLEGRLNEAKSVFFMNTELKWKENFECSFHCLFSYPHSFSPPLSWSVLFV